MTEETLACLADAMEGVAETVSRGFALDLIRYQNQTAEEALILFSWLLRNPAELKRVQDQMRHANERALQTIIARN